MYNHAKIISQKQAKKLVDDHWYMNIKLRSPKLYGIARNYSSAMREIHKKIRHMGSYGDYQYATIDNAMALNQGSLVYVYPSVTFYRIASEIELI